MNQPNPTSLAAAKATPSIAPKPAAALPKKPLSVTTRNYALTKPSTRVPEKYVTATKKPTQSVSAKKEVASILEKPLKKKSKTSEKTIEQAINKAKPRSSSAVDESAKATAFAWPVRGKVISHFGPKEGGIYNDGMNISATEGTPVAAAAAGEVVYADDKLKGYGNLVIIKHDNGYYTSYAHKKSIAVTKGQRVSQGQTIGYVGKTGSVTEAQLQFGIRKGKEPVNPERLLERSVSNR